MRPATLRLYYVAAASNILALGILLWGITRPPQRWGQVLAVMLTAMSTVCWLRYFRQLRR